MKYAIITGASRGLGQSVAKQMLERGIGVFSISRTDKKELSHFADEQGAFYQHIACDLNNQQETMEVFARILAQINDATHIYIINNAGVVDPIETAGHMEADKLIRNVQVNLLAPMLITNLVLQKATEEKEYIIVNVTSGAANRPVYGWSAYCSTKAGINRFTQTVAEEQMEMNTPNKVIAFSPGVMDTDMQKEIRSSSKQAFKEVDKFKAYKENGQLRDVKAIGEGLVRLLESETLENGRIYEIDDIL